MGPEFGPEFIGREFMGRKFFGRKFLGPQFTPDPWETEFKRPEIRGARFHGTMLALGPGWPIGSKATRTAHLEQVRAYWKVCYGGIVTSPITYLGNSARRPPPAAPM